MNNDFDKSLQDLLRNHTEQPSLDCWDKIASGLDAAQTTGASSAAADAGSSFSQFAGSVVGKIAATTAIAVSLGAAVYFAVADFRETEQTLPQQAPIETRQDALYEEYTPATEMEKETKPASPVGNIAQTTHFTTTDTAEKNIKESASVVSPAENTPAHSSNFNSSDREPAVPSQEKAQVQEKAQTVETASVSPAKEQEKEPDAKEQAQQTTPNQPHIGIPNIFTPNGDGKNDYFVLTDIEEISENQLDVFTRNGNVVYRKVNYDNSWDGRGLPDGTYYYIFRFIYEGNQFMRQGSVTIKR